MLFRAIWPGRRRYSAPAQDLPPLLPTTTTTATAPSTNITITTPAAAPSSNPAATTTEAAHAPQVSWVRREEGVGKKEDRHGRWAKIGDS
ncbi:hypothetical protein H105_00573 [Trichophyton soudanense CBS 452.61]|uniref:Uncharacterized protein n=1 Tax=Trichophyton soudanense CBS 452.61 TaxID=1215331 RepID=A0A022Y7C4_TRISD|nr:hypothetical protein H100_00586 [Trichophyton rubrum MR850]EZF67747.1 hypothetical protein H104_00575 [Trichophyton rubrum CBS 289.86]EZF78421.1 hypothetical protein H105_00573 [Trichophyton soudanense CBS 452.61]EZF89117.1 hypothetical protein H110_00589 [Trichophyton rubrum MR1448]EZG10902.1 hypothetical protein H106_00468 [Trichophyton rubrum CBS 735.88]